MLMTATVIGAQAQKLNPWGLVYDGALTENVVGEVQIRPVTYMVDGISVSANVYLPKGYDAGKRYAAVVVSHPNGGVKEQVSGMFAQKLAEAGYVTSPYAHANDGATAPVSCLLDLMMWDATDRMALITQPLLMMTGEKSDSRYMTEEAMEKATGTQEKEMFVVSGASHIKTYYEPTFVEQERTKVVVFFDKYLAKP